MDTIIDRWGSQIFDDEEINLVCEAIESMLFRELLNEENFMLSIHCAYVESDETDRVISYRNRTYREVDQLGYAFGLKTFERIHEKICDYPVPQIYTETVVIKRTDLRLVATLLKLSTGYIYFFVVVDDPLLVAMAQQGVFGLALTICKMLSFYDEGADKLMQILPSLTLKNLCDTERNSICRCVDRYFESDQKAVACWREDHL